MNTVAYSLCGLATLLFCAQPRQERRLELLVDAYDTQISINGTTDKTLEELTKPLTLSQIQSADSAKTPSSNKAADLHSNKNTRNDATNDDFFKTLTLIETPEQAANYCTHVLRKGGNHFDQDYFGASDYWASAKKVFEQGVDDCDGSAVFAAAALRDNNYPSYVLLFEMTIDIPPGHTSRGKFTTSHTVFIYFRQLKGYGTIGCNQQDIIQNQPTMVSLLRSLEDAYCAQINWFSVYDLEKAHPDFVDNEINNDFVFSKKKE